jgi:tubulin polyglutamylase TTLL1
MSGLRWRSDLTKLVITSNFEARGWQAARNEDEWDIWWASVSSVQQLFAPSSLVKLRPGQLVNHFTNHYELTHKVCAAVGSRCNVCARSPAVSS